MRHLPLASLAVLCSLPAAQAMAQIDVEFRVVNDHAVGSTVEFDRFEGAINNVLEQTGIAECAEINVEVVHIGSLTEDHIPDGAVDQNTRRLRYLQDIEGFGGNVLVLGALSVCGSVVDSNFGGCAGRNTSLTVELLPLHGSAINGLLWLHEFGHTVGLAALVESGRSHATDPARVMHAKVGGIQLTQRECEALQAFSGRYRPAEIGAGVDEVPETPLLAELAPPNEEPLGREAMPDEQSLPPLPDPRLDELLAGVYPEGIPDDLGLEDDPELLDAVAEVLRDPALEPYRANAADLLEAYGDQSHVDDLITSLQVSRTEQPPDLVLASDAATLEAIGEITSRTAAPEGERFLFELALELAGQAEAYDLEYDMGWLAESSRAGGGLEPLVGPTLRGLQAIDLSLGADNLSTLQLLDTGNQRVLERYEDLSRSENLIDPLVLDSIVGETEEFRGMSER